MVFRVGGELYRVRLTERLNGGKDAGLWEWTTHMIWLAADMPARRRLGTLLHELKHAWQAEFGRPTNDEDDANQSAAFTADVWRQLDRQGGEAALLRLTLDGEIDRAADIGGAGEPRNPQCPSCGGYLELPIHTGEGAFHPAYNRLAAVRSGICEFCSHTVSWPEGVTTSGVPTGHVLGGPTVCRPSVCS